MLARKVPSALYVDFNNIVGKLPGGGFAEASAAWLAWLEDGQFDPQKRKRVFIQKRVYIGQPYTHLATKLEVNGFQAILSSADMIIALDLVESIHQQPAIREYILLSVDIDFEQLLERLGERSKARVATIEEGTPCARSFPARAEIVFPVEDLKPALLYKRRERHWRRAFSAVRAAATGVREHYKDIRRRLRQRGEQRELRIAAGHVATVAHETPGVPLGKDTVLRLLAERMPEFNAARRYASRRAYQNLIQKMTEIRDDLQLFKYPNGGISIMAKPREGAGRDKNA